MPPRDTSLDTLLDLDGQVLGIDPAGHWVRFVVHRVAVTPDKPHGLDYSMTLHAPDGQRWVGFDNAHRVQGRRSGAKDHRHRHATMRPYEYRGAARLVEDFWAEVDSVMRQKGIWP